MCASLGSKITSCSANPDGSLSQINHRSGNGDSWSWSYFLSITEAQHIPCWNHDSGAHTRLTRCNAVNRVYIPSSHHLICMIMTKLNSTPNSHPDSALFVSTYSPSPYSCRIGRITSHEPIMFLMNLQILLHQSRNSGPCRNIRYQFSPGDYSL